MNSVLDKDLFRYSNKVSFRMKFSHPEIRWLICFRKVQYSRNIFLKYFYKIRLHALSNLTQIQIPTETVIGEGFYIGHTGRIIINPRSILGKNINISTGVVVGQENRGRRKGAPMVGNNVWIGANSVLVGNIHIGDDVLIAPLAYVNFNVPSHSIVIGNPGKIIPKEGATDYYINRTV